MKTTEFSTKNALWNVEFCYRQQFGLGVSCTWAGSMFDVEFFLGPLSLRIARYS